MFSVRAIIIGSNTEKGTQWLGRQMPTSPHLVHPWLPTSTHTLYDHSTKCRSL